MPDVTCVDFLQWALPRLSLTWPGFRRVHRQVCKRIARRLKDLRLQDCSAYRAYLESHREEWELLDSLCRISISRWYRDRLVFDRLAAEVLPALAAGAKGRGERELRVWSAGCASGEEAYSISILWALAVAPRFPGLSLRLEATDVDATLLARAAAGRYRRGSLREVPPAWLEVAFTREGDGFAVRPEFRVRVAFREQDLRRAMPAGPFDLILCRNVAFTYFDLSLQRRTLERMLETLRPEGAFVIGLKERLPEGATGLAPWVPELGIYRKGAADR